MRALLQGHEILSVRSFAPRSGEKVPEGRMRGVSLMRSFAPQGGEKVARSAG